MFTPRPRALSFIESPFTTRVAYEAWKGKWAAHDVPIVPDAFFHEYVHLADPTPRSDAKGDAAYWDRLALEGAPFVILPTGDGPFGKKWPAPIWGVCARYEKRHGPPPIAHVAKLPRSAWPVAVAWPSRWHVSARVPRA